MLTLFRLQSVGLRATALWGRAIIGPYYFLFPSVGSTQFPRVKKYTQAGVMQLSPDHNSIKKLCWKAGVLKRWTVMGSRWYKKAGPVNHQKLKQCVCWVSRVSRRIDRPESLYIKIEGVRHANVLMLYLSKYFIITTSTNTPTYNTSQAACANSPCNGKYEPASPLGRVLIKELVHSPWIEWPRNRHEYASAALPHHRASAFSKLNHWRSVF